MKRAGATAVVVLDDDHARRPIGVITEADVVQAVADGKDVNDVRIRHLMTNSPTVCAGWARAGAPCGRRLAEPEVGIARRSPRPARTRSGLARLHHASCRDCCPSRDRWAHTQAEQAGTGRGHGCCR